MTALRLRVAVWVYGGMAALAALWGLLRGNPDVFHDPAGDGASSPTTVGLGLATGIAIGVVIAALTRLAVRRTGALRRLHLEFRGLFGPLSDRDVLVFAALSAGAEELFFRGALQPAIGLPLSVLVFGFLHVGPSIRVFWPWTLSALAMGLLFGVLFRAFGDLTAPIAAHFTVNFLNLGFIADYDPAPSIARGLRRAT